MGDRALVTGGGGFLGTAICRMLHERGDQVVACGRQDYPHLQELGIATRQVDLRDAMAVDAVCAGMDIVYHAGAIAGIWGPRRLFWDTNYEGTRHVIAACRRHGVGRLVYTSSPSVVFGDGDLCAVDESWPYPAHYSAHYPASKGAAERAVLAAHGQELATVALRPHLIWGPGDRHLIPRIVDRARRGRLRQVGDGTNRVDIVYVDNAATAHLQAGDILAAGGACGGKPYFISQGEPVVLWSWVNELLDALGAPRVERAVSYAAARRIGGVLEVAYRLLGIRSEPPMTRFLAAQLAKSHYFDISGARRDFGYVPTVTTAEGLERLVAAFGRCGSLPTHP